ncbi:MAG: PEP-CTERM sorting domain-containing protein [Planctomycetota bacterium]
MFRLKALAATPVLVCVTSAQAALITTPFTDTMDNGDNFFTPTRASVIDNTDGTVTIERLEAGDAFVRYSPGGTFSDFFAIGAATNRVEIDFTDFNLGGIQVRIDFGSGSPSGVTAVSSLTTPGTFVIPDVEQLAIDNGRADATQYRLFFRITGGALPTNASGGTIDEIRVIPEPASALLLGAGGLLMLRHRRRR